MNELRPIFLKKKKRDIRNILLDFIVVILIALVFIPQFKIFNAYNYLCLIVTGLWVILAFLQNSDFFLGKNKFFLKSLAFFVSTILVAFVAGNLTIVNRYASLAMIPLFYWIYSYNSIYRGVNSNIIILFISLIFILYTSTQTILALIISPYAVRGIKTSIEGNEDLIASGVSGYGLIYAVVILTIVLIPLFLDRRRLRLNFIWTVCFISLGILFLYLIILSNYFTALVVTVIGGVSIIIFYKKSKIFLFIAPGIFLYLSFYNDFNAASIDFISSFAQSDGKTYVRLQDIKRKIETGSKAESVDTRSEVMNKSLELFIDYPLFGYIVQSDEKFNLDRVGQHSYVLDTYALYGFFLGTGSIWIMWQPFRYRTSRKYEYRLRIFGWITGAVFMILITFNNLTASMGYAAFFAFPSVFDYINRKKNNA